MSTTDTDKIREALKDVIACFDAAEIEGLSIVIAETADERLKDLIVRRVMYARYVAEEALNTAAQAPVREVLEPQGWREAMQEFVDRCERGEILSRYTYSKFKALLAPLPAAPVQQEGGNG